MIALDHHARFMSIKENSYLLVLKMHFLHRYRLF